MKFLISDSFNLKTLEYEKVYNNYYFGFWDLLLDWL